MNEYLSAGTSSVVGMTELGTKYKTVRQALGALQAPWDFPPHLIWRLAAMLGNEELQYVDAKIEDVAPRLCSAEVIVFTPARVVYARMQDGPTEPDPRSAATFSVTATTWSRASLITVELAPDPPAGRNSDAGWSGVNLRESEQPVDPAVTLTYADRKPVTLPLGSGHSVSSLRSSNIFSLLPSLLHDVGARACPG